MASIMYDPLFGAVEDQTNELLERGRSTASKLRQPLDTTHLVRVALSDDSNVQLSGYFRPEVAQAVQNLLQTSMQSNSVDGSTSFAGVDSSTHALRACAQMCRAEGKGRPISPRMLLWAIFVSDQRLANLLEALRALHDLDVDELLSQLHSDYERLYEPVRSFGPWAADQALTSAVTQIVQEQIAPLTPTDGQLFAHIHEVMSTDVLEILARAWRFQQYGVVVVVGMHGTIVERIPQTLADRLTSADPVLPEFRTVIQVSLNSILRLAEADGLDIATAVLHGIMAHARDSQALLVVDHLDALDDVGDLIGDERIPAVSRLTGVLGAARGVLVVARYWTAQPDNPVPPDSILYDRLASEWQTVYVEPYNPGRTRSTISDHFFAYWAKVYQCQVEASAFEEVLAFSEWIHDSHNRIALPYAAIFLGTNAAITVKKGSELIRQRAGFGLERIRQLRTAATAVSGLAEQLTTVFEGVERVLRDVYNDPEVKQNKDGLSRVTRGHVAAELFGTNVYHIELPNMALPQAPDYSQHDPGVTSRPLQVPPDGPGYKTKGRH